MPRSDPNGAIAAREAAVDKWLADPDERLLAWAQEAGVVLEPRGAVLWNNVERRLNHRGLLEVARAWVAQQVHSLTTTHKVTKRQKWAKELAMRFVEDRIYRSNKHLQWHYSPGEAGELELLPEYLRWVVCHPGLGLMAGADEVKEDPVCQAVIGTYERLNKCPNQAARNRFMLCLGDKKATEQLFKDVDKLISDERKKKKDPGAVEDDPAVVDAECAAAEIDKMLAEYGGE